MDKSNKSKAAPSVAKNYRNAAAKLGRKGGSVCSPKKALSSRANGKKGGRPRFSRVLSQLDVFEHTLATNAPINRKEGHIKQANYEKAALKECRQAKKILASLDA